MPVFMKLDILGALDLAMISVIMSFLFVNLFDTAGTLLGVANQARLVDEDGNIHNLDKALKADSSSSAFSKPNQKSFTDTSASFNNSLLTKFESF